MLIVSRPRVPFLCSCSSIVHLFLISLSTDPVSSCCASRCLLLVQTVPLLSLWGSLVSISPVPRLMCCLCDLSSCSNHQACTINLPTCYQPLVVGLFFFPPIFGTPREDVARCLRFARNHICSIRLGGVGMGTFAWKAFIDDGDTIFQKDVL